MNIPILRPIQRWECPNCDQTHITHESQPHTPFHTCAKMGFLTTPFVPEGTKCKMVAVEREDYVGKENVQLSKSGRPVMNITTIRDDGQDCTVFAPCAGVRE